MSCVKLSAERGPNFEHEVKSIVETTVRRRIFLFCIII